MSKTGIIHLCCLLFLTSCLRDKFQELPFVVTLDPIPCAGEVSSVLLSAEIKGLETGQLSGHGFVLSVQDPEPQLNAGDDVIPIPLSPASLTQGSFEVIQNDLPTTQQQYYVQAYIQYEGMTVYGGVQVFSFFNCFHVTIESNPVIKNNTIAVEGLLVGLGDVGESVSNHGFVYALTELNDDPKLNQENTHVKMLGFRNENGNFEALLSEGIIFNKDYSIRSFVVVSGQDKYSEDILNVRIEDGWILKPQLETETPIREAVAVVTEDDKVYMGVGCEAFCNFTFDINDFWKFDPTASRPWEKLMPFPDTGRVGAVAFEVDNKIYFGLGKYFDLSGHVFYLDDFWEFNPEGGAGMGKWDKLDYEFPGDPRSGAVAFSVNGYGYVGTGEGEGSITFQDFYRFDPQETNPEKAWLRISDDLPLVLDDPASQFELGRQEAVSFTIGENQAYVGTGQVSSAILNDLWKFVPNGSSGDGSWSFVGLLPDEAARTEAVAFSLGEKAYIGMGMNKSGFLSDFWEFDPVGAVQFKLLQNCFPGMLRRQAIGFGVAGKGYVGTGRGEDANFFSDIWEYTPKENP